MKKLLFLLLLFISCQKAEVPQQEEKKDIFAFRNDTAEFYLYKDKYENLLISDSLPILEGYRLPSYEEAQVLHTLSIAYSKRCLCLKGDRFYTFKFNNAETLSWARETTKYTYWPVKCIPIDSIIHIEVDDQWKSNASYPLK